MDPTTLLAPLSASPDRSALVFDVDGTLAPIVARPELSRVPDATRAGLERLRDRYLLVACLSGRSGEDAARLVRVAGIRYVGNHGLELDPRAHELEEAIAAFRDRAAAVWPVEDKGLSLSFHFREASDEASARATLLEIAEQADGAGLDARWGRKVLEVRPRVDADKGTAVRALLAGSGARLGLYAGDDTTDVDAFRGLEAAGLEHAVRVAVSSDEAAEALLESADLVVDGPAGLADLLALL